MSRRLVTFSKTIEVIVDTHDDLSALREALNDPGLKAAFDDAQTIFEVADETHDRPLGIIIRPRVMDIIA